MEGGNNQPGGPNQPVNPDPQQGQEKVSPMSPNFMAPGNDNSSPSPSNPPVGGTPSTPPPPLPPPPPAATPPPSPPTGANTPPSVGGNAVPPPPPRQVDIRTMGSDQSSLKASGGTGVAPQTVKTNTGMPKKIDSVAKVSTGSGRKKALFIGLGIVVFLAAAAAVANYLVIPFFFRDVAVVEEPEVVVPEEGTDTDQVITPTVPTFTHQSYFTEPVDDSAELAIGAVTKSEIEGAVTVAAGSAPDEAGAVTEFYFTVGNNGRPVAAEEFMEAMVSDVGFATELELDFTGFTYSDGTGQWTGYVFAIASDTIDKEGMKEVFNGDFESSSELANLFVEDPGTPSEDGFKSGVAIAEGGNARYLSFSNTGASLNYGWKGDFLVVSTSFEGFKAAIEKLGDATGPAAVEAAAEEEESETATSTSGT